MLSQKLNYQNIQSYFFLVKTSLSNHFFDLSTIKSLHIISYRFVMLLNTVKQFMTSPEKNYAVHCHMLSSFYFWTFPVKNDNSLHLGCSETFFFSFRYVFYLPISLMKRKQLMMLQLISQIFEITTVDIRENQDQ